MRLTPLHLDEIRRRLDRLDGLDVWADGDEIGAEVRGDLADLLAEVNTLRARLRRMHGFGCTRENCKLDGGPEHKEHFAAEDYRNKSHDADPMPF